MQQSYVLQLGWLPKHRSKPDLQENLVRAEHVGDKCSQITQDAAIGTRDRLAEQDDGQCEPTQNQCSR